MSTVPSPVPSSAETPGAHPRRPRSRQWLPLVVVIALALAIVVPPLFNISRYQHRIAENISRSVARPVHFSHISLRLLPRPGFDLTDFTVEEGPGFGAEPILHSSSVRASIRLLSLWRGRLEMARIALDEPSLNLVRNAAGQWNFASVVTQASSTAVAPTGQLRPTRTLRFPYIEATNARINFKYGDEKQPFSFLNGDLSLWLENPQEWQLRFAAQPVRTDLDLFASNTGLVRIEGAVRRAPALGDVPLNLRVEWTHAPLGQLARLAGTNSGWRGKMDLRSQVTGTPTEVLLSSSFEVSDLHRVEFQPARMLNYAGKCTGSFHKAQETLDGLACVVPVGSGKITLAGTVRAPAQPAGTELALRIIELPAASALDFLRLTREKLGASFAVAGSVDGQFTVTAAAGHTHVAGSVAAAQLAMTSPSLHGPLAVSGVQLTAMDTNSALPAGRGRNRRGQAIASPVALLLAPVRMDFGAPAPVLMDGRLDRGGFLLHFGGRAELGQLIPVIQSLGIADPGLRSLQPAGEATLDLQMRGPWLVPVEAEAAGEGASTPAGTITLKDARLVTAYLAAPLVIKSAQGSLLHTDGGQGETQMAWSGIVAQYGPVHLTGNFRASLPCGAGDSSGCTRQFDITLPALDLGALSSVLAGRDPLMRVFLSRIGRSASAPDWPSLHGTVRTASATLGSLALHDAVASLSIKGARVQIESLDAGTLEGTLHLTGAIEAGLSPAYHLDAQLNQASVPALGELFHQAWGPGVINMAAHLALHGAERQELMQSAQGIFHFDWSHGALLQAAGAANGPAVRSPFAHFDQWTADGQVQDGGFTLEQSLLTSSDGARAVQGTIGFGKELDLKTSAAPGGNSLHDGQPDTAAGAGVLGGTLALPEFVSAPRPDAPPAQ